MGSLNLAVHANAVVNHLVRGGSLPAIKYPRAQRYLPRKAPGEPSIFTQNFPNNVPSNCRPSLGTETSDCKGVG